MGRRCEKVLSCFLFGLAKNGRKGIEASKGLIFYGDDAILFRYEFSSDSVIQLIQVLGHRNMGQGVAFYPTILLAGS